MFHIIINNVFLLPGFILYLLFSQPSFAQQSDSLFQAKTFSYGNGEMMPYRLYAPRGYNGSKKYPLILWLHGAAGRGTDNVKNISDGNELGSHFWTYNTNQKNFPCFVVAPQCPETTLWVSNDGIDSPPDQLDAVIDLVGEICHSHNIDTTRMYVVGQSMGGVAVWEIIARYPKMFAAALPLCGIGNKNNVFKLTQTPIWVFHGTADDVVPVAHSRDMVDALKRAGGHPKYSEYKNVGHDVWNVAFKEPNLLQWVFGQHRGK